jgi:N-acetyltransferase 10
MVKGLLGPYLVLMSSTINGYEGTGRSISLKLLQELRANSKIASANPSNSRMLTELSMNTPIRYAQNDQIEQWLNQLLLLDCTNIQPTIGSIPHPSVCELYLVNRDTLFSGFN